MRIIVWVVFPVELFIVLYETFGVWSFWMKYLIMTIRIRLLSSISFGRCYTDESISLESAGWNIAAWPFKLKLWSWIFLWPALFAYRYLTNLYMRVHNFGNKRVRRASKTRSGYLSNKLLTSIKDEISPDIQRTFLIIQGYVLYQNCLNKTDFFRLRFSRNSFHFVQILWLLRPLYIFIVCQADMELFSRSCCSTQV